MEKIITDINKILDDFEDLSESSNQELPSNSNKNGLIEERNISFSLSSSPSINPEETKTPKNLTIKSQNDDNTETYNYNDIPFFKLGRQMPQWTPDTYSSICLSCQLSFSVLRRRHHCRACGKLLCSNCCKWQALLRFEDNVPRQGRVCAPCFNNLIRIEAAKNRGKNLNNVTNSPNSGVLKINKKTESPKHKGSTSPKDNNTTSTSPTATTKSVVFEDGLRPGVDQNGHTSPNSFPHNECLLSLSDLPKQLIGHFDKYYRDKLEKELNASNENLSNFHRTMKIDITRNLKVIIIIESIETKDGTRKILWRLQSIGMFSIGYPEITVVLKLFSHEEPSSETRWWCTDDEFHNNHHNHHCYLINNGCDLWLFSEILKLYYQYYVDASKDYSSTIPNHPSRFKLLESKNLDPVRSLGLLLCPITSSSSLLGLLIFSESELSHARLLPLRGVFSLSYLSNVYPYPCINDLTEHHIQQERPLYSGKADSVLSCVDYDAQHYYSGLIAFVELSCSVGFSAPQVNVTVMKKPRVICKPRDKSLPSRIPKVIFIPGTFLVPDENSNNSKSTSRNAQLVCVEDKGCLNLKPRLISRAIHTQSDVNETDEDSIINAYLEATKEVNETETKTNTTSDLNDVSDIKINDTSIILECKVNNGVEYKLIENGELSNTQFDKSSTEVTKTDETFKNSTKINEPHENMGKINHDSFNNEPSEKDITKSQITEGKEIQNLNPDESKCSKVIDIDCHKQSNQQKSPTNNFSEFNISRINANGILIIPHLSNSREIKEPPITIVEDLLVINVNYKQYNGLYSCLDDQTDLMIRFDNGSTLRILWEDDTLNLSKHMTSLVTFGNIYELFTIPDFYFPSSNSRKFLSYRVPIDQQLLRATKQCEEIPLLWSSYHVMLRVIGIDDGNFDRLVTEFARQMHFIFLHSISQYLELLKSKNFKRLGFYAKFGVQNDNYNDMRIRWDMGGSRLDTGYHLALLDSLPMSEDLRESDVLPRIMRFISYMISNHNSNPTDPIVEAIELQYTILY